MTDALERCDFPGCRGFAARTECREVPRDVFAPNPYDIMASEGIAISLHVCARHALDIDVAYGAALERIHRRAGARGLASRTLRPSEATRHPSDGGPE